MRTITFVALASLLFSPAFSKELKDTVVRTFYPNGQIKKIETYKVINDTLIPHGLFADYFPNGQIKDSCILNFGAHVGKRIIYSKKGFTEGVIQYGIDSFPRKILVVTLLQKGPCRMIKRELTEYSAGVLGKDEVERYYWRSGYIMDSVITKNNLKFFRARFYDGGGIDFTEEYPINAKDGDEVIVKGYNPDGTIKYSRIEIRGKSGY